MPPVSPVLEKEVFQAVKLLQKRKGVTTRSVVQYLVTFCDYEREKAFSATVRRVLRKFVRRGEAQRDGLRYKLCKDTKIYMCKCSETKKTRAGPSKETKRNPAESHGTDVQNPASEGSSKTE